MPTMMIRTQRHHKNFLKLWATNPPIISVNAPQCSKFAIYDHKNPNAEPLVINKDNSNYQWLFTGPFLPAGSTHYVAVDLEKLADARELDSMSSSSSSSSH